MRRGLGKLALATAVVAFVSPAVTAGVATADVYSPALELHLDSLTGGTTPDSSPNHLTAAAQATQLSDGRFNNAFRFGTAGDQVGVANTAVLAPVQVTVMAWVRQPSFDSTHYGGLIAGKPYATAGCHTDSYALTEGLTSGVRFVIDTDHGGQAFQYATPDSSNSSVWDNHWHAVAGTYDGTSVDLYEDGQLVETKVTDGWPLIYDPPAENAYSGLYAGIPPNPASCSFSQEYDGDIDEIRVYDRALSAAEIATLQDSSATGPPELTPSPIAPTVSAVSADGLTTAGATLHGTVNPNGFAIDDCHFDLGTSPAYGTTVPCAESVGGGMTGVPVSAAASGLNPNTTYDFDLVAHNAGGTSSNTGTFTTPAIDTAITSGPSGATNNPTPTFGFTANPPDGATFVCSIDHGTSAACNSGQFTTPHLSDGLHEVEVAAVTAGGTRDPTPATQSFFVDTVAPQTTLQVLGGQRSGSNIHGTVILGATGADPPPSGGGVGTHCELLGAADPAPASYAAMPACTVLTEGKSGSYVLYGASADAAGNVEAVRSTAFVLQAGVDVSITSGVFGSTWDKEPQFAFTSHTLGARFLCRIDNSAYSSCQSPWVSPVQNPGAHIFHVEAVAPDGTQSSDLTDYYTINAPQTVTPGHCAVDPFIVNPTDPNGGRLIGCGFGSCPRRIACSPALPACPTGAICTLKFRVEIADADPAVTFKLYALCQQSKDCSPEELDDSWIIEYSTGVTGPPGVTCEATADSDPTGCSTASNDTFLGSGRATSQTCYMELFSGGLVGAGETQARDFGPDSSRHIECDDNESIAPASPLDIAGVSGRADTAVFAPGAGTLILAGARTAAVGARKQKHTPPPGFSKIKITVKHAGAVGVHFRLNAAAKGLLARRHKLALRVKIALALRHQAAITKTHTIIFSQPPKAPSKRELKARARALCLRKHPGGKRVCDRL